FGQGAVAGGGRDGPAGPRLFRPDAGHLPGMCPALHAVLRRAGLPADGAAAPCGDPVRRRPSPGAPLSLEGGRHPGAAVVTTRFVRREAVVRRRRLMRRRHSYLQRVARLPTPDVSLRPPHRLMDRAPVGMGALAENLGVTTAGTPTATPS